MHWILRGRRSLAAVLLACWSSVLIGRAGGQDSSDRPWKVSFAPESRRLEIIVPAQTEALEIRLESPGLTNVETGTDVNEPGEIYLPPSASGVAPEPAENGFFFNELVDAPDWELVMRFRHSGHGQWKLNGRFSPLAGTQAAEVTIPVSQLEQGENLLHLTGERREMPALYFRRVVQRGETNRCVVYVRPFDWSACAQLWRTINGRSHCVAEEQVVAAAPPRRLRSWAGNDWDDRERLREAALAVGDNICRNQNGRPGSMFEGGFNLVYDPSHKSPRISHWIWSWGPAIDLLLKLARLEADRDADRAEHFRAVALAAGKRSLEFGVTDPAHPACGVSTVRWEPSRATPLGWAEYASPTDSLFLAGWGWMSLYEETRNPIYLERTRSLTTAVDRLRQRYGVIPQDWIFERERWTPHTLDESLFGTIGFRRLHEATAEAAVVESGRNFVNSFLNVMARTDGLLARGWMRAEKRDIWDPDIKGHAWVMEGYLDAYRLAGEAKFLALARQLASEVMACQAPSGGWTFQFHQPNPGDAIDDKGTAIWAYMFYELHRLTGESVHLSAARRALGWCLRHQYRGGDPNLDGAILHENSMAYVRRRPMTVFYTTSFFGLAVLDEIALRALTAGAAPGGSHAVE